MVAKKETHTVLRELHDVVQERAVAIEGPHPGQVYAAAVCGVQAGLEVPWRVRQLSVKREKQIHV